MALRGLSEMIRNGLRNMGFLNGGEQEAKPNLANGGFTGYRPGRRDPYGTQSLQIGSAQREGGQYATPGLRTGWTEQRQVTGRQTGYMTAVQQDNGWTDSGLYAQQGQAWTTGPQQNPAWVQQNQGWPQQPVNNPGWPAQQQEMQPAGQTPQQPNNIVYMNAPFVDANGRGYRHCERVVQLQNVAACFRVIEFMRNNESVIVNMEAIAADQDLQRCLDMLAGAAFTLSCSLTKITSGKRAYLIAPEAVQVLQENAIARLNEYRSEETRLRTGTMDEMAYRPRESQGFGRRAARY